MVKRHARKDAARKARQPGQNHQQAVEAVRQDSRSGQQIDNLLYVVDLPSPRIEGHAACSSCHGSGAGDSAYELATAPGGPPLLLFVVCRDCLGCGRVDHGACVPGVHATDDPYEVDQYLSELDEEAEAEGQEVHERCPSCQDRKFNFEQGFGQGDAAAEKVHAELRSRCRARGVAEFDMMGAAAFGQLDELLGDGAQALMETADTTVYLRVPCGCAEALARTVRREEFDVHA